MISNRTELKRFIEMDMNARWGSGGVKLTIWQKVSAFFFPKPWKFQILMRKAEYYCNHHNVIIKHLIGSYFKFRTYRYGTRCGYSIPLNIFGPGLVLGHIGTIVINGAVRFGSNARIQSCVNIGAFSRFNEHWKGDAAPRFGDNIYIGPGVKIFGPIYIGNNVAIGANAVVSKDIPDHCTVVEANKIINQKGSVDMIRYGDMSKIPVDSYAYKQINLKKEEL